MTLAQRLVELHKDKWKLASYPLERHACSHPEAWQDQYRRIRELCLKALGGARGGLGSFSSA